MFCRSCGTENEENAKFCRGCGLPIVPSEEVKQPEQKETPEETGAPEQTAAPEQNPSAAESNSANYEQPNYEQPNYGQPNYGQPNYGQPNYGAGQPYGNGQPYPYRPQYSGASIVCLILGIVSVISCCTVLLGVGCGIASIIIYAVQRKKGEDNGMLTAGMILGIVGIVISVIAIIVFFVSGNFTRLMDAIRSGNISDYFRSFGGMDYSYWS